MESPTDHGQTSNQPGGSEPAAELDPAGHTGAPQLAKWLLIYTAIRIGMLVVLAAVLYLVMPLILALLFAVILALPLSWLLFGGVRRRVNEAMAASTVHRRAERERLRSALDGRDQR
ncbi:Flp pilus assembly protein TadB [Nakamurella sp. UYEF19]|uniref:DUF4229 domain-containing protein n=1 Tax=Nakamurella sp. UYEF19 TaxID=1756392 RepID=UPI00339B922F